MIKLNFTDEELHIISNITNSLLNIYLLNRNIKNITISQINTITRLSNISELKYTTIFPLAEICTLTSCLQCYKNSLYNGKPIFDNYKVNTIINKIKKTWEEQKIEKIITINEDLDIQYSEYKKYLNSTFKKNFIEIFLDNTIIKRHAIINHTCPFCGNKHTSTENVYIQNKELIFYIFCDRSLDPCYNLSLIHQKLKN